MEIDRPGTFRGQIQERGVGETKNGYPQFVLRVLADEYYDDQTDPANPALSKRFEFFIAGMEVGNAYSELNDPIEQRNRFEEDIKDLKDKKTI